jgi:hypothetical protein
MMAILGVDLCRFHEISCVVVVVVVVVRCVSVEYVVVLIVDRSS